MERLFRKIGVLVAIAGIAASAYAQQSPAPVDPLEPAEPPAPQYRVEVIVFAYNEADPTEEIFRPRPVRSTANEALTPAAPLDLAPFDLEALTDLNDPAAASAALQGTAPLTDVQGTQTSGVPEAGVPSGAQEAGERSDAPFRFRILESEELQLGDAYARLERLDAYTPLLHGGWIQDGLPENQARPFDLAYLGTFNPAGTVRLHVSRFLHLTLDLDYRPTPLQRVASPGGQPNSFGLSELSLAPKHVMSTSRRVRSGDLNYFDHPYFGLIVVVTPYEPTPETPTESVGPAA